MSQKNPPFSKFNVHFSREPLVPIGCPSQDLEYSLVLQVLHVGTLFDASKQIFFLSIVCSDCKNTVFCMLGPSLINQNEFSLEVTNAVIARILFSAWWDILWCIEKNNFSFQVLYDVIARKLFSACWDLLWLIKTNLVLRWQMQWMQEYYFLHVGTFCDASKQTLFWSDECSNIAGLLFSTWWNIVGCIKTNFLLKYCMQWLQEYYFPHDETFSDESKRI